MNELNFKWSKRIFVRVLGNVVAMFDADFIRFDYSFRPIWIIKRVSTESIQFQKFCFECILPAEAYAVMCGITSKYLLSRVQCIDRVMFLMDNFINAHYSSHPTIELTIRVVFGCVWYVCLCMYGLRSCVFVFFRVSNAVSKNGHKLWQQFTDNSWSVA